MFSFWDGPLVYLTSVENIILRQPLSFSKYTSPPSAWTSVGSVSDRRVDPSFVPISTYVCNVSSYYFRNNCTCIQKLKKYANLCLEIIMLQIIPSKLIWLRLPTSKTGSDLIRALRTSFHRSSDINSWPSRMWQMTSEAVWLTYVTQQLLFVSFRQHKRYIIIQ